MVRCLHLRSPPLLRLRRQRPGHHSALRHQRFRLFHRRDKQAGRRLHRHQCLQGTPFFACVAPLAPHDPSTPARRDAHDYDGVIGPRLSSFNEADVSDKPSWIRQLSRLTSSQISAINKRHENRVESLQAVDDLVEGIVNALNSPTPSGANALDNTYVFFTSDNGFHHGEHRILKQKWRPYEEDIHIPLLVRGPGVAAGSTTYKLTLNTDYLPTFTNLACSSSPCDTQN